jgi:hypothetical protein
MTGRAWAPMTTPVVSDLSVAAMIEGRAATDAGPEVERSNLRRTSGHSSRSPGETIFGCVVRKHVKIASGARQQQTENALGDRGEVTKGPNTSWKKPAPAAVQA